MKNLLNQIDRIQEEIKKTEVHRKQKFFLNEMKKVGIEKLPYAYTALKRFIDAETMDVHYNKHYKGYVEKLNLALDKKNFGDLDLEHIVKTISKFSDEVRNNAGGAYNHALFWKMLSPKEQKPKGLILKKIEKEFGSVSSFKKKFDEEAKKRFGSGWVWLVVTKNNKLKIMSTPNQDNPLMNDVDGGGYPILGLDLWEHAFYLKYKNQKNDYIKNFWKVVNWEFVEKLYKMKLDTKLNEELILSQLMNESTQEILFESTYESKSCTKEESNLYRALLTPSDEEVKRNPDAKKFKSEYIAGWNQIFRSHYPDRWVERNLLKDYFGYEHEKGLYDKFLDKDSVSYTRSVLNNITSSYSAFCVLHRDLNYYLVKTNQEPIHFELGSDKNLSELRRFFSILYGIKDKILDPENSKTFKTVESNLKFTRCMGERNEMGAKQIIEQNYGEDSCKILAGAGLLIDMEKGIDAEITLDDKKQQSQIKPFTGAEKRKIHDKNYIAILGSSSTKRYHNVEVFAFINMPSKTIMLFKNEGLIIGHNEFIFPEESKIAQITAKKPLMLKDCRKYLK